MAKSWLIEFMNAPAEVSSRKLNLQKDSLLVGRIAETDISIPWDPKISRAHAKLEFLDQAVHLTDLDSRNGSYYSKDFKWRRVKGSASLPTPAVIRCGDAVLSVAYGEFAGEETSAFTPELLSSLPEDINDQRLEEAILVLDQCGSTTLAGAQGDQMAIHLKKRLFELCDSVFKDQKPAFVKNTGDGFMATFARAGECFETAVSILKRLKNRNAATNNPPINVRIGLHSGQTYSFSLTNPDRHGNDVNTAFRIEGVKKEELLGGPKILLPEKDRIIASRAFLDALSGEKEPFELLGQAELKGLRVSVELYLCLNR